MSAKSPRSTPFGSGSGFVIAAAAVILAWRAALLPSCRDRRGIAGGSRPGSGLELGSGRDFEGFARATEVRPFVLPADHGPHFAYQAEW